MVEERLKGRMSTTVNEQRTMKRSWGEWAQEKMVSAVDAEHAHERCEGALAILPASVALLRPGQGCC